MNIYYPNCIKEATYLDTVSQSSRKTAVTEKAAEKCSLYEGNILRGKAEYCAVLALSFLPSLPEY